MPKVGNGAVIYTSAAQTFSAACHPLCRKKFL